MARTHGAGKPKLEQVKEFDPEVKIRIAGSVGVNQRGETVPREIIRKNGKEVDIIVVEDRVGGAGYKEYWMFVSEGVGGGGKRQIGKEVVDASGGGFMGEALEQVQVGDRKITCRGYDQAEDADIYVLTFAELCLAWDYYRGKRRAIAEITETQRRARQANMDKALEAKKVRREERRQKRVKGEI